MSGREPILKPASSYDTYKDTSSGSQPQLYSTLEAHRHNLWPHTSVLLLAEVIGTGVLALAGDMVYLGWTLGIIFLLGCSVLNIFAGRCLWEVTKAYPSVTSYSDIAAVLFGPWEQMAIHVMIIVTLFLVMANYLLVLSLAIKDIFYHYEICQPTATIYAALLLLVPSQLRTLHLISPAGFLSTIAVVIVLIICMAQMFHDCGDSSGDHVAFAETLEWEHSMSAISSFVFATGGQIVYVEMIGEMVQPATFPLALGASVAFMLGLYGAVATSSYYCYGNKAPSFLIDVLPHGWLSQFASVLIAFHVIVSYVLHHQVFARKIHVMYSHHIKRHTSIVNHTKRSLPHFWPSTFHWLSISVIVTAAACFIANVVPFFSELVSLIGSLTQSLLFYTVPALFYIKLCQRFGDQIPLPTKINLGILVFSGVVVFVFGTYSNVNKIISKWSEYASPFSCTT